MVAVLLDPIDPKIPNDLNCKEKSFFKVFKYENRLYQYIRLNQDGNMAKNLKSVQKMCSAFRAIWLHCEAKYITILS